MRYLISCMIPLCLILAPVAIPGAEGDLAKARSELDLARTYKYKNYKNDSKFFFHATGTTGDVNAPASYKDLVDQFPKPLEADPQKRSPQELYRSAIEILTGLVADGETGPAAALLRDALAEYIEGEILVGNQDLIDALRSRFPRVDDKGKPTESLKPSVLVDSADAHFRSALDSLRALRTARPIPRWR